MLNAIRMSQIMTPRPVAIGPEEKPDRAKRLMEKHRIRHLPVTVGDAEIVGIVSERDLHLARYARFPDALRIADLMKEHPHCVSSRASAAEALRLMTDFKAGAIAVTAGRRTLQGIFTRHDALELLGRLTELEAPLSVAA